MFANKMQIKCVWQIEENKEVTFLKHLVTVFEIKTKLRNRQKRLTTISCTLNIILFSKIGTHWSEEKKMMRLRQPPQPPEGKKISQGDSTNVEGGDPPKTP